jgi:hypothetical protein
MQADMTRAFSALLLLISALGTAFFALPVHASVDANVAVTCCVCSKGPNSGNTCVNVPEGQGGSNCEKLPSTYPSLNGYTCAPPVNAEAKCASKTTSASGICSVGPVDIQTFKPSPTSEQKPVELTPPSLNVQIPGLDFATVAQQKGRVIHIPFLAQYISAVYRFLISIAMIAAAIMVLYGGFLMILGQTGARVREGKDLITNALIGLALVLGARLILGSVNAELLQLKPIEINVIETVPFETVQKLQEQAAEGGFVPDPVIKQALNEAKGGVTPTRVLPNNPFDSRLSLPKTELNAMIDKIAKAGGVDPCIAKAIVQTESAGNMNAIGHDEDSPLPPSQIPSRAKFLNGGTTYTGAKIGSSRLNDDNLTDVAPDFGLDWRFSHGFGIGQCTIFPKYPKPHFDSCTAPDGLHGVRRGGVCYTVPILMTWEGQIGCLIAEIRAHGGGGNVCKTFCQYGGMCSIDPDCTGPVLSKKMRAYAACGA